MREYRDESRDCAYRARISAVFVALAIDPAQLPMTPAPPPAPVIPPAPPLVRTPPPVFLSPAPAPAPAVFPAARLDLGATALGGVGPDDHVGQVGAELRWSGGRHRLGPEAGVTVLLPIDNTVGGVRLRQWRLPLDAGVRARILGPRFERYGELGVSAALLSERALNLAIPSRRRRSRSACAPASAFTPRAPGSHRSPRSRPSWSRFRRRCSRCRPAPWGTPPSSGLAPRPACR